MNPYVNEDIMWQRLKDRQLEAENRRRYGTAPSTAVLLGEAAIDFGRIVDAVIGGAFRLAGAVARRRPSTAIPDEESPAAADVA